MTSTPIPITISQVCYQYRSTGDSFELGPIDLEIPPGRMTFWVGRNGSGKTTLARILCGEMHFQSGTISGLNGSSLHHHQSVSENLFSDLRVRDHFRLLSAFPSKTIDLLRSHFPEIPLLLNQYPDQLSGGQLQLVAFATSIARQHDLYVFDEVLNHLDLETALRVVQWLREKTVLNSAARCILVTHDLDWVYRFADIVHVFAEGRISAVISRDEFQGSPDKLLRLVTGTLERKL